MPSAARVSIVGGGLLGMTLALRLRAAGLRVCIIEGSPGLGGLASSQTLGRYTWDRFYHVILLSDAGLRALLEELQLTDRLRWGQVGSGFYTDGRFHPLSTTLDFLRFPPLRMVDKARLAATILRAANLRDWQSLEGETAATWLVRWSGQRTYDRLWRPLLRAKLGENADLASAAFIWAIIARMYAARRSGLKREMFGYVEGGYATILGRFRDLLMSMGVEFRCGAAAVNVHSDGDIAGIALADGTRLASDYAILTVPCGHIAALCPQLEQREQARLRSVIYQGIVCPSLLLRRPLAGYYVTNITEPWVPFTAVIEMTTLVDRNRFDGHTLAYLPRYASQSDPIWRRSDSDVLGEFIEGLRRMYPDLQPSDIVATQVARAREVLALSTCHYSERFLPPARTSLGNVFVVNSAQIAQGTLNVNETVELANSKAREILPTLTTSKPAPAGACAS
jgi:protoporphyrinogen oxidase